MSSVGKMQVEGKLDKDGSFYIEVWGRRITIAHIPNTISLTPQLAQRLGDYWSATGFAATCELTRKINQEMINDSITNREGSSKSGS